MYLSFRCPLHPIKFIYPATNHCWFYKLCSQAPFVLSFSTFLSPTSKLSLLHQWTQLLIISPSTAYVGVWLCCVWESRKPQILHPQNYNSKCRKGHELRREKGIFFFTFYASSFSSIVLTFHSSAFPSIPTTFPLSDTFRCHCVLSPYLSPYLASHLHHLRPSDMPGGCH